MYMEKKLIIPLFKAIVRPYLEYCVQARRPYQQKDINKLESVPQRATTIHTGGKLIPELRHFSYERRLGLTTLEIRRLRGDLIEVFKILNGYEDIESNISFKLKEDSMTRGHKAALVKPYCRLDTRKYSFPREQ